MQSKISVIIPAYNNEKNIARCIESLLDQSFRDFTLIIINDGSTDSTKEIIRSYQMRDERIIFIDQKNQGVSSARNRGLSVAEGKYVTFVDADDYVSSDYLKHLFVGIDNTEADLCITGFKFVNEKGEEKACRYQNRTLNKKDFLRQLFEVNGSRGYVWNKIWKRDIISKYNLRFNKDISMAEDLLFTVEYGIKAKEVKFIDSCDYYYETSSMGSSNSIEITSPNVDNTYIRLFSQWLQSLQEIRKQFLSFDVELKIEIESEICLTNVYFLRNLYVKDNKNTFSELKEQANREAVLYHRSLFKKYPCCSRERINYILTLYFPVFVKSIDIHRKKN